MSEKHDISLEAQLYDLCMMNNQSEIATFLNAITEDQMIELALQSKQHVRLEEVAKYFITSLAHETLPKEFPAEKFLTMISKYKLVNTKLEGWINLYLSSRHVFSQVHDVQWKEKAKSDELPQEEIKSENQEWLVKSSKSEIGQAVANNEGKIIWVDHYTSWLWERSNKDIIGKNFFDFLSDTSRSFCSEKFGETFFGAGETLKVMSYDVKREFECASIDPKLSKIQKVFTSQFTRILLSIKGSDGTQNAVHIKTRPASKKTVEKFSALQDKSSVLPSCPSTP